MLLAALVVGYQNPRVNAQSMLTRHYLVRQLFGDEFDSLMHDELMHCVKATEALRNRAKELDVKMGHFINEEKRAQVREVSKVIADWEDVYDKRWAAELAKREAPAAGAAEGAGVRLRLGQQLPVLRLNRSRFGSTTPQPSALEYSSQGRSR